MTAEFDAYFEAVAAADAGAAADLLAAALERGEPRQRLVRDVIIPAQRRVGELWASGAWNVADEHAATAVSEHALTLLANPGPGRADPRDGWYLHAPRASGTRCLLGWRPTWPPTATWTS